jgi:hypothetical protein
MRLAFTIKKILLALLLLITSKGLYAQLVVTGFVRNSQSNDSLSNKPLAFVAIENLRTNGIQRTNKEGKFNINARVGDSIVFSRLGYFTYTYVVIDDKVENLDIQLLSKKNVIEEVIVTRTKYEKDSLARASIVKKGLDYEQVNTISSPVTSVYQQFSRKYKDLRKFQSQYKDNEQQRYIDTKYTYDIVNELTKLHGDVAAFFMNAYPMEYKFARTSSEVEIKAWILNNFKEWTMMKERAKKNATSTN